MLRATREGNLASKGKNQRMKNILFAFLMISFMGVAFAQTGDFHLDKEYKVSNTGAIDLSSSDAKVFITGSNRSNAHVKIDRTITVKGWHSAAAFSVEVQEINGDLKLFEHRQGANVSVGYYNESYKIEIEVPANMALTVRGDDGDYIVKNINGAISMSLDDADADLTDCKGDKFKFRFDDGDLRMNTGNGTFEFKGDDSDVEIYNAKFETVHADVDDGDLIIETSLSDQGEYDLQGQDGLISLNVLAGGGEFNIHHDDGHVNSGDKFQKLNEDENETTLTLASGSAKVKIHGDDARIKLTSR
jgi:hypothetical protein